MRMDVITHIKIDRKSNQGGRTCRGFPSLHESTRIAFANNLTWPLRKEYLSRARFYNLIR